MDDAIADPVLAPFFPTLQLAAPMGEAGASRLMKSLSLGIAPIERFQALAWGRAHETLSSSDLQAVVLDMAERPGGLDAALEIIFFRLFGDRQASKTHEPEVIDAGRALLSKLEFTRSARRGDHHRLGLVVSRCLAGAEGAAIAQTLCLRFKAVA